MLRRLLILVVTALLAWVLAPAAQAAPGGGGGLECEEYNDRGVCVVFADPGGDSGGGGSDTSPVDNPGGGGEGNGGGDGGGCGDTFEYAGLNLPCESPELGTYVPSWGCYVRPADPQPPKSAPVWQGNEDGAIYTCAHPAMHNNVGAGGGTQAGDLELQMRWSATDPRAAAIDPAVLAQEAVESMNLQAINIGIAPRDDGQSVGLIGMPTWMWTENPAANTTGPITRSASAGGVTVTATGTLDRIEWDMGDGTTVTCNGPGTAFQVSYGDSDSPDCGHRYQQTSANQPGQAFTVTATSYWTVEWNGGGESGTIPLDFAESTQIQVGELQVLATNN